MIRRLRLENWRAYNTLDVELGPGTTFVVAPNGVGKTSLVEAAAWALFGDDAPTANRPVRAGASSATVTIEVELPDRRILSVTRTHPEKRQRRALDPVVLVDGAPASSQSLPQLLHDEYGADPAFLARVAMPRPQNQSPGLEGGGLNSHLCRLFGVESLLAAATDVDARLKVNDRRIRAAKQGGTVDKAKLAELTAAHSDAAARTAAAAATYAEARAAVAAAEAHARIEESARAWDVQRRARHEALTAALNHASRLIGVTLAEDGLAQELAAAAAAARAELAAAARAIGANEGQQAALEAASASLDAAEGECPVCRRPLDVPTTAAAHAAQARDLERLRRERDALAEAEAAAIRRIDALAEAAAMAAQVPVLGPRPALPAEQGAFDLEGAREAEAAALASLVAATAASDYARAALAAAVDDETAHTTLVGLFATDAVLRGARGTINETARVFVDRTVRPIAAEIGPRWSAILPGRGGVAVSGAGALTRPAQGEDLDFDSFSGGERTVALVLLRLLVVQMTTKASFCWFDEPLEHLDPDVRRQVASLLAGAGNSPPLRQVLLTTYEQPLAERLAADSPGRVSVVAVRSGAQPPTDAIQPDAGPHHACPRPRRRGSGGLDGRR